MTSNPAFYWKGAALGAKNSNVSAIATEALIRIGTPTANASAIRFSSNAAGTTR